MGKRLKQMDTSFGTHEAFYSSLLFEKTMKQHTWQFNHFFIHHTHAE